MKAPCETLVFGHTCSRKSVTESGAQQGNRLTLSRPRDFISASADRNKGSEENPPSSHRTLSPTVMQTKSSPSGTPPGGSHTPQPDGRRRGQDLIDRGHASSGEKNDAVHQNQELGGKDEYVPTCFCIHKSKTELTFSLFKQNITVSPSVSQSNLIQHSHINLRRQFNKFDKSTHKEKRTQTEP